MAALMPTLRARGAVAVAGLGSPIPTRAMARIQSVTDGDVVRPGSPIPMGGRAQTRRAMVAGVVVSPTLILDQTLIRLAAVAVEQPFVTFGGAR